MDNHETTFLLSHSDSQPLKESLDFPPPRSQPSRDPRNSAPSPAKSLERSKTTVAIFGGKQGKEPLPPRKKLEKERGRPEDEPTGKKFSLGGLSSTLSPKHAGRIVYPIQSLTKFLSCLDQFEVSTSIFFSEILIETN